jgi:hypothetical protein
MMGTPAVWDQLFVPIVATMLFGNFAGACVRLEPESDAIETVSEVVPPPLPTTTTATATAPTRPQPPPERRGVVRGPLTSFPYGAESDCSADVVDAAGVVWLVSGQDTCRWLANVDGTERCVDGDDDALRLTWLGERRDTSDAFHQRSERDGLLSATTAKGAAPVTFKVVRRDFCLK